MSECVKDDTLGHMGKRTLLIILDGWGYSKMKSGNPITEANVSTIEHLERHYPMMLLQASGNAVGLPWGEAGNSEVGHLTLGSGRIITQPVTFINKSMEDRDFFKKPALIKVVEYLKNTGGRLHLAGLLTSGSVHANFKHLTALLEFSKLSNINDTFLHLFTDGKDSRLKEGIVLFQKLEEFISQNQIKAKIVSLIGRNYAMDRNKNWGLTEKAYALMAKGEGNLVDNLSQALKENYESGITDESIPPQILRSAVNNKEFLQNGDALVFFNFREDSMRQITSAFSDANSPISSKADLTPPLSSIPPLSLRVGSRAELNDLLVVSMVPYSDSLKTLSIFDRLVIKSPLAEVIEENSFKQLHIAETEKYAHITYFFNGLREEPFRNEEDFLIPSVKDIVNNPNMQAREITNKVLESIKKNEYDFTVVNFANPDMLAHTGNFQSAVLGVQAVDQSLGWILKEVQESEDTLMLVTADHGNIENLVYSGSGEIETRHDLNPVPIFLVNKNLEIFKTESKESNLNQDVNGFLSDVAPTILEFMGLSVPPEMTGQSLLGLIKK